MSSTKSSYTIAGIGEVLWDLYHDSRHLGGAPANFAIHASQLGDDGIVISRVGDDGMGAELIRELERHDIRAEFIQTDRKKGTGTVLVTLDIKGIPSFRCSQDVAFDYLELTHRLRDLANNLDAVVFGTLAQRRPESHKTIIGFLGLAKSAVKVFDLNSRADERALTPLLPDSLRVADILKMNDDELNLLRRVLRRDGDSVERFVQYLIDEHDLKLVVITFGSAGCWLFDASGKNCRWPGYQIEVVDTTGAGDAFLAGLVHEYLRSASLEAVAEFASLFGAFLCTRKGATARFTLAELEDFKRTAVAKTIKEIQK